uniref:Uncharacterized protein n=1 Tax=Anguilla anguilla TaxID=7936 RepID=A0A0E9W0B2_ANGAN
MACSAVCDHMSVLWSSPDRFILSLTAVFVMHVCFVLCVLLC